jgi:hypothetical protein
MLPQSVKSVLWSYDVSKIDVQVDRQLVISQVLNFGDKEAVDWAVKNYGKGEMRKAALLIPRGRWNKKSLAFWSLILKFDPDQIKNRFE